MAYQVLARKWRPKTFGEMVGQEHVLKTLINALDHDRLHHAYLFTGTRGVGKTTIARILSKCLNCEVGVSSAPCGKCGACKEIDEGRFVDLIEVDAASRTKVEDTRELLENVQYAPTRGRYKVYLIDEVHMLSTHSFNALLKTLEEPPPHVKFLFATTDPQKLPATILSRCLQFSLKNMPPQRIVEHLTHILSEEMIEFEEASLWEIGRAADGSVRDAMSLADQAIAFGNGCLTTVDVRLMLGTIDRTYVLQLIEAIAQGNVEQTLEVVDKASQFSPDYMGMLGELVATLHRIAVKQALPQVMDNSLGDGEIVAQLAQQMTAEDVQLYYQTALVGRKDLPLNPDGKAGFEMVLLRMLLFKPGGNAPKGTKSSQSAMGQPEPKRQTPIATPPLVSKNEVLNNEVLNNEVPNGAGREQVLQARVQLSSPSSQPVAIQSSAMQQDRLPPMQRDDGVMLSAASALEIKEVDSGNLDSKKIEDKGFDDNVVELVQVKKNVDDSSTVEDEWFQLVPKLGIAGNTLNMARNCSMESRKDNHFVFALEGCHEALVNSDRIQRLQDAMAAYFKVAVTLTIDMVTPTKKTPDQWAEESRIKKLKNATAILHEDPVVQSLQRRFQAVIDPESITPKL